MIPHLKAGNLRVPTEEMFTLPEKVLQFGTGVLLRGLPDYFIDRANSCGMFNGRIVVVKSTGNGGTDAFEQQDGLYTLLERGFEDGKQIERACINASISRVLSANEQFDEILACAANPGLQLIISNTTEVGISLVEEDAVAERPVSFPGRLLAFLLERYRVFEGKEDAGMVIVPTELIVDNGDVLRDIVLTLARKKGVSQDVMRWLEEANDFCNSLVDCIVPGKLPGAEQAAVEASFGYEDALMITSEPYRLWAIETQKERTESILSFAACNPGVVIAPDINRFRELKLRLLNATHTLSCGLAHLSGFATVKEAMNDTGFASFVTGMMRREIVPLVATGDISRTEAEQFAAQVIDRFKNPYIEHLWLSITVQYTSKMAMRVAPLVQRYYAQFGEAPPLMALGFAAFLRFMKSKREGDHYAGFVNERSYTLQDDKASLLSEKWSASGDTGIVADALGDPSVFGSDLLQYPGFAEEVNQSMEMLKQSGAANTLRSILAKKTVA